jgi:hypothetical protein
MAGPLLHGFRRSSHEMPRTESVSLPSLMLPGSRLEGNLDHIRRRRHIKSGPVGSSWVLNPTGLSANNPYAKQAYVFTGGQIGKSGEYGGIPNHGRSCRSSLLNRDGERSTIILFFTESTRVPNSPRLGGACGGVGGPSSHEPCDEWSGVPLADPGTGRRSTRGSTCISSDEPARIENRPVIPVVRD